MLRVNLFDSLFDHSYGEDGCYTCSFGRCPIEGVWVKNNMIWDGVTVFTDSHFNDPIVDKVISKIKIAWLLESKAITPNAYRDIIKFENKFDYIFTHDDELLSRGEKYIKTVVGASRVPDEYWGCHEKTKLVSHIGSFKKWTDGHQLRHIIADNYGPQLDLYGTGFNKFESKLEPHKDYAYSITVVNTSNNNYFTEGLIDAISLGCVPILWGFPNYNEYFNPDGIIYFENLGELEVILKQISFEDYNYRKKAIIENIERAREYKSTDDYIFRLIKNIIK